MRKTVIVDKGERITLDSGWLVVSVAEKDAHSICDRPMRRKSCSGDNKE